MLNKIKNNKALKIIGNIIYYILLALVILILAIVILQRVSKNNASIGGIRIFNIVTESMFPEYQIGDVLISKKIEPSKIKVGDDLVYLGTEQGFAGRVVTHRVVDIEESDGKYRFHTKGLANEVEDPAVQENQIYRIVIYKTYILSFITKIINNIYEFYFLIFIPLTILIIVKFVKIRNEKEKDDSKENEIDKK